MQREKCEMEKEVAAMRPCALRREEFIRIRGAIRLAHQVASDRHRGWKLNEKALSRSRRRARREARKEDEAGSEGEGKIETCQVPDHTREPFPREFTGMAEAKSRWRRHNVGIAGNERHDARETRRSVFLQTFKIKNNVEKYFIAR